MREVCLINNIANVFIEAYEDDIEVTPEMLIDAGWSYEQLAQFMRCCNILRSISTFHEEHLASSYHEKVKQVCMSALEEVSDLLSDLIGVRVEWDLLSCSVLYGRHFQKLFYKDDFANDLDWFIINHIEWLIHTHEGNIQYMNACDKWQTDLDFVNSYNIDSQRAIWGELCTSLLISDK